MTGVVLDLAAQQLATARRDSQSYQLRAADPSVSAWVSANAGTGKTYVLVTRVLRLLLAGATPGSLLCLTFTKAAAAEMSNRLTVWLGEWAAMPDAALGEALAVILQREPKETEKETARQLFAAVLDAPGGLKIMTIHAFCDRVLRRFPLEAGVAPSFAILTDEERRSLLREAADAVLHDAARDGYGAAGCALQTVISHAGEDRFQDLLQSVVARQETLRTLIREQMDIDPFPGIEAMLRVALGAECSDTPDAIRAAQEAAASDTLIERAVAALLEGKKTDHDLAKALSAAKGRSGTERIDAFRAAFLTEKSEARADSRYMTKALRAAYPAIANALCQARDVFAALEIKRHALGCAAATAALYRLASAVIERYEALKLQRGAMDFDGLIAKTAALFQRSDASAWVLFRLDSDLRHILVDEAQDTSPAQWALVRALTAEFFAGDGVEDRTDTLFAVGDEKQSIYGFQGADPRLFAEAGRDYSTRARAAHQSWLEAPLTLSYRSTRAVIEAVDRVFASPEALVGLTADDRPVRHFAHREGEAGLVEIWQPFETVPTSAVPAWEPFSEAAAAPPSAYRLAAKIAGQIRFWLDSGKKLASLNRPISAGDVLILVRKRAPFAAPMVKALKSLGVPVAGSDRMIITDQLAVMDLMALGEALLLPEDDLTLATLLKSPIFGLSEEELFDAAYARTGPLFAALSGKAHEMSAFSEAVQHLDAWRAEAGSKKPYEFYMARLEGDGMRARLLARLGPDAADAIDEFLNLALTFEAVETPTLQGFLHWLRLAETEVKRDMDAGRDEVRVMTVHGSKGLEANIVFLADTCSARTASRGGLIDIERQPSPFGASSLPVWFLSGSRLVPAIGKAYDAAQQAERAEYRRLLYVAMTRARDRLYVGGFQGKKGRDTGCWYDLIYDGLEERLTETCGYAGDKVLRMECPQVTPVPDIPARDAQAELVLPQEWDGWRQDETPAAILINPSRLDPAQSGSDARNDAATPRPRAQALLRGRLVHRLLEQLPSMPRDGWEKSGAHFLASQGADLPAADRQIMLGETIHILTSPQFGDIFGPGSRAETPFSALLDPIWENGPPIRVTGQIDRLVLRANEALILDYKTGADIPASLDAIPSAYLAQLAAYRLAIARVFGAREIRAALLWIENPLLMDITPKLIEEGEAMFYKFVKSRHLDNAPVSAQL